VKARGCSLCSDRQVPAIDSDPPLSPLRASGWLTLPAAGLRSRGRKSIAGWGKTANFRGDRGWEARSSSGGSRAATLKHSTHSPAECDSSSAASGVNACFAPHRGRQYDQVRGHQTSELDPSVMLVAGCGDGRHRVRSPSATSRRFSFAAHLQHSPVRSRRWIDSLLIVG
jgi:hypothetical protein